MFTKKILLKEIIDPVYCEVEASATLNLTDATLWLSVGENKTAEGTIKLSKLIADEIKYMKMDGLERHADKSDYNLKELRKCVKLLEGLIKNIESLPE